MTPPIHSRTDNSLSLSSPQLQWITRQQCQTTWGGTKTTRKVNIGPWQQGNNTGGDNNGSNDGPPSSPAHGEDNNATAGNDQGNAIATDAGMSSVILAASNTPNHEKDANMNDANAKNAIGKKTLMRDVTAAELTVALWHWRSSFPCATLTLAAARTIASWHCQLPPAPAMVMRCLGIVGCPLFTGG